ncbi:MAG: 16S rRNA (adenine(1518)-N(6)/adenine(1519)-N(6))-dimethyltransferase RsmA [bacterium]|nr:16S rRNA (adenine(1518)-N(6)/adenine(1519)-N(6))-dimethyltransferase RsmA [bacterium]
MNKPQKDFKILQAQPKRSLSQNFLTDEKPVRLLLEAAGITKEDVVVEIGAGLGALTKELVRKAGRVIALEKDEKLAGLLAEQLKEPNLNVIAQDALTWKPPSGKYKVVGNLPYAVATPIVRKFLEEKNKPESITVMLQLEVALRIMAQPPKMNLLAASIQFYASPSFIAVVKRNSFWPQPNVDSAIIFLSKIKTKTETESRSFFRVLKAGFSQPRKQLRNNIASQLTMEREEAGSWLSGHGIDSVRRAQTLSLEEWMKLAKDLKSG